MTKTIFALRGKAKTGKTTTIKKVYELLKNKYTKSNQTEFIVHTDIKIIIIIDGIKIGIESQGDPGSRLDDSLKDFVDSQCDIILCAARTRGMTNNWINEYSNQFKIVWIEKQTVQESDEESENQRQANEIVQMIEAKLKKV